MSTFKACIVGGGFIGRAHVEALRRLGFVQVAALCDVRGAEEAAAELHIPSAYADFGDMLMREKPDVVHICTPNVTHYNLVKQAILSGVHVVCEKPFMMDVPEAEEIVRLADEKGILGYLNFHNRFFPMVNQMRKTVLDGTLGALTAVYGSYFQDWLLLDTDYSWRLSRSVGGKTRTIGDIGSHFMDLAEFVTGARIIAVMAQFKTQYPVRRQTPDLKTYTVAGEGAKGEEIAVDTEDMANLLLRFDNGAIGSASFSQMFAGKKNGLSIGVTGTKESATWSLDNPETLWFGSRKGFNRTVTKEAAFADETARSLIGYPAGHMEGFPSALTNGLRSFYRELDGHPSRIGATFADGLHSMQLCETAFCSAQRDGWAEV